ncbi:MAG TPA: hypothetical protein VGC51_11375 [Hansschlegelia sp.]
MNKLRAHLLKLLVVLAASYVLAVTSALTGGLTLAAETSLDLICHSEVGVGQSAPRDRGNVRHDACCIAGCPMTAALAPTSEPEVSPFVYAEREKPFRLGHEHFPRDAHFPSGLKRPRGPPAAA